MPLKTNILIMLLLIFCVKSGFPATNELLVKYNGAISSKTQSCSKANQPLSVEPLFVHTPNQSQNYTRNNKRILSSNESDVSHIYKLTFAEDVDLDTVAKIYRAFPEVDFAEPNQTFEIQSDIESYIPNDTGYGKQWALNKIGAEQAWPLSRDNKRVVVAVLDTGVDYQHEDLVNNIWRNLGETAGNNKDDDGNGFVDDDKGWDFVDVSNQNNVASNEDGQIPDNDPRDLQGHGTHLAGIIAAKSNNQLGISGLAYKCQVMPVRVGYLTANGNGSIELDDAALGIKYAVDNGAAVINLSFGGNASQTLDLMLRYAADHDVVVVAAAGNQGSSTIIYPASQKNVIAVGATDSADQKASWSNTGTQLGLTAPGVQIYSALPNNKYGYKSGTSMSTAFVAASAALLLAEIPTLSVAEVMSILTESSEDLGVTGFDQNYGFGRIDVFNALSQICPQIENGSSEQNADQVQNDDGPESAAQTVAISSKLLSEVLFAPNPFRPNQSKAYIGYNLNGPATVELYIHALNGELIYSAKQEDLIAGDNKIEWAGVDNFGDAVPSGAYLGYLLVNSGNETAKALVKIAIQK